MCTGIAVHWRDIPETLIERDRLQDRVVVRGENADREFRFLYRDAQARLPVWLDGELTICTWGNRDDKQSRLPRTGWCRQESLQAGRWSWLAPRPVVIPACYGLERGVWFQIKEGLSGIVVQDERDEAHVYMLTEAASHYYQVMTRHDRMPILIGERI